MNATARHGVCTGLVVAWVAERDVLGRGAVDQRHFVQAVSMSKEGWSKPRQIADLGHGLLSRIEPEVGPIWGYAGKRLNPMLVEDGGDVWMLWERKTEHEGRSTVPGELSGRRFDGARWHSPRVLHRNLVQYQVPSNRPAAGGRRQTPDSRQRHDASPHNFERGSANRLRVAGNRRVDRMGAGEATAAPLDSGGPAVRGDRRCPSLPVLGRPPRSHGPHSRCRGRSRWTHAFRT